MHSHCWLIADLLCAEYLPFNSSDPLSTSLASGNRSAWTALTNSPALLLCVGFKH